MSLLFPRFAYAPVRCGPVRHNNFGSLFSLFDETARELQQAQRAAARQSRPFNPRFDVKEDKESYVLEGEVPGFQEADLSIEWNDNTLAVSGRHESVTKSGNVPESVEASSDAAPVENTVASETSSVKSSHQPTVEDEEPASSSTPTTEVTKAAEPEAPAKSEPTKPELQHWISERRTGQFLRQFQFPANAVNHDSIKASLQSGILKIVVPKAEPQASRRINIE